MAEWKECLRRATLALEAGGGLFICYSIHCPRVKIGATDVAAVLLQNGMNVTDIVLQKSHAHSQRVIITARKEAVQTGQLFIPRSSPIR